MQSIRLIFTVLILSFRLLAGTEALTTILIKGERTTITEGNTQNEISNEF